MASGLPSIVRHLMQAFGEGDADTRLAIGIAVQATQDGHVCADLDIDTGWGPWASECDDAARSAFRKRLPGLSIVGGASDITPLVWDGRRLSLRRYWSYERALADDLLRRSRAEQPLDPRLADRLQKLLPDAGQRAAAQCALTRRLTLVSGGPGTGKTTTLARMIRLLREQADMAGLPPLRIALAAPTGKAAARMAESLEAAGVDLPPGGAMTLHRLLGMRAQGRGFRHDAGNPLAVDLLVIDEASMIDLSLMAHVLAALPTDCRLVMLGDRDQLAAVEAGAVFADLCASPALADTVVTLMTNFRFSAESGIGNLANALRSGDGAAVAAILRGGSTDLAWQTAPSLRDVIAAARAGYAPYLEAVASGADPATAFDAFARFRVLAALRGEVDTINRALAQRPAGQWFAGLPVMVTRNDPMLHLYNGDVGLVLPDPADGELRACFPGRLAHEPWHWISPQRLASWAPAWAMTVHKSQGSEFGEVLLLLPTAASPVATRELVYTGVTRARALVSLWASEDALAGAIERRAERMSGLREQLAAR